MTQFKIFLILVAKTALSHETAYLAIQLEYRSVPFKLAFLGVSFNSGTDVLLLIH